MRIHPTAEVSPQAQIGEGCLIWHQVQIRERATLGPNCIVGKGAYIDFEVRTSIGAKPDIPADIIIFSDKEHKAPYIVYELKKEDISPKEFEQAVDQGFSYAITQNAKYVVVSNGTKQA